MMRRLRIIAVIGWPAGSVVVWLTLCNLLFLNGGQDPRGIPPVDASRLLALAGALVIPSCIAVLAMRGRLPFTGERDAKAEGFAVVQR